MRPNPPKTGLYLREEVPVITSVDQKEGKEGTVVTLRGSGFSERVRNNCIVVGGMGACARAQRGSTPNELKARIDPVPRPSEGDISVWVGFGSDFYHESVAYGRSRLRFSETAIFRNGTPIVQGGVSFRLTEASQDTYGGTVEESADGRASLGGHERGFALRARFPKDLRISSKSSVDICLILKEHPTLAIDFTASIEGEGHIEDILRSIAKTIVVNGRLVGETVFADVVPDDHEGGLALYVTRPYLETGLLTVHFGRQRAA